MSSSSFQSAVLPELVTHRTFKYPAKARIVTTWLDAAQPQVEVESKLRPDDLLDLSHDV
jgi:hypothetical protein